MEVPAKYQQEGISLETDKSYIVVRKYQLFGLFVAAAVQVTHLYRTDDGTSRH